MRLQSRTCGLASRVALALLASLALGCGAGDEGHRVSGKVTFKGQPVPAGKVMISPDTSKGNKGPTGFADIQNGVYDTGAPGGKGAVAGAVIIAVDGIDPKPPPGASPDITTTVLFPPYELRVDLPAADSVQNVDVPAGAELPPQTQSGSAIVP